jgi:hypothetical protein
VREVDKAALVVPDVLASNDHAFTDLGGHTLPNRDIVHDEDCGTGCAPNDKPLVKVLPLGIGEIVRYGRRDREPDAGLVLLKGCRGWVAGSYRGARWSGASLRRSY